MSKTPEEMAEEYGASPHEKDAFLAGYQAAKDTYKDAISAYEDVAKQMLEEAVRIMSPTDPLAGAGKVMNSPERLDSSNSSNNSNGWISVKERLPEIGAPCLVTCHEERYAIAEYDGIKWTTLNSIAYYHPIVTHWQELSELPKEEK